MNKAGGWSYSTFIALYPSEIVTDIYSPKASELEPHPRAAGNVYITTESQ